VKLETFMGLKPNHDLIFAIINSLVLFPEKCGFHFCKFSLEAQVMFSANKSTAFFI